MVKKWVDRATMQDHLAVIGVVFSVAVVGYVGYHALAFVHTYRETLAALNTTTDALIKTTAALHEQRQMSSDFLAKWRSEQVRNDEFAHQISGLTTTVGQLDKLSKTDRELLQKYSKVYFLNENFVPSQLSDIAQEFLYRKEKPEQFHARGKPYLENLLRDANNNGAGILILSGYRSFGAQTSLKVNYTVVFGAGTANQFSADQGYSEHQLGTTVDFTTSKIGEVLEGFEKTPAYSWLTQNAHRYGFILSYPDGNTFYEFEPWHWRYVGVELATRLFNEKKNFYSYDQREIDTYLVKIFD